MALDLRLLGLSASSTKQEPASAESLPVHVSALPHIVVEELSEGAALNLKLLTPTYTSSGYVSFLGICERGILEMPHSWYDCRDIGPFGTAPQRSADALTERL